MKIAGIQKMTLLDYPGRVACTLFTAGCNFRCPFCHNASLVCGGSPETDEDEIISFLKKRVGLLDGVVITGGEPLIHPDILDFMGKVKELGYKIKLDTNGTNPDLLKKAVGSGLCDSVAMDIKNSLAEYPRTVGLEKIDADKIVASRDYLMSGNVGYEFRTTVVKGLHTKESLLRLSEEIAGAKHYYLQQFKNSGDLVAPDGLSAFDRDEMFALADIMRPRVPSVEVRGV